MQYFNKLKRQEMRLLNLIVINVFFFFLVLFVHLNPQIKQSVSLNLTYLRANRGCKTISDYNSIQNCFTICNHYISHFHLHTLSLLSSEGKTHKKQFLCVSLLSEIFRFLNYGSFASPNPESF